MSAPWCAQARRKNFPLAARPIFGNALDGNSYAGQIKPADTFVQLVGVAHPSPAKAAEFRKIDLASGKGAVEAARARGRATLRLHQRRPTRSSDEGLHQSAFGVRGDDPPKRNECHHPSPVVRTRTRSPLAVPAPAFLQADGTIPADASRRHPPGIGYVGTDDAGITVCRGKSSAERAHR